MGKSLYNILLVEDDREIIKKLTEFLNNEGFNVESVTGQKDALSYVDEHMQNIDIVLLDVSLEDGNGFAVCTAIKQNTDIPVIFLTASGDEYSVVMGLDMGADDYIGKPFRPRELVSRIKSVLRRSGRISNVIELADIKIDTTGGKVIKSGEEIFLSALEYRLLLIFAANKGVVLSRNKLLEEIWDASGEFVNDNTLTVYIKRLREKIENDAQKPEIIKTVRGMGYKVLMNFFRNGEIKKYSFINLAVIIFTAVIIYLLSDKNTKLTAVVCAAGIVQFGINMIFTKKRYTRLAKISDKIDAILHGDEHLSFEQYKEGELSVLSDEVEKLVIRLREQTENLKNDKVFLADSIADISHQIKTPLTSINLILNFLREEDITYERRMDLVMELTTLAEKIKWQITTLLRISRLDADMVDFDIENIDMGKVIDEAYSLIEIPLDIRGIEFERSYEKKSKVKADREWLVEALGNILKNCMEHSFNGGKISVTCEENTIYSRIVISDNGVGIAKEDLPHIFERFYKGKKKNDLDGHKSESVGIGLALSRSIITQFNGTIKVTSEVGKGTSFDIRFYKGVV